MLLKRFGDAILMTKQIKRLRFGVRQCSAAFSWGATERCGSKAASSRRSPKRGHGFPYKAIADKDIIRIFEV